MVSHMMAIMMEPHMILQLMLQHMEPHHMDWIGASGRSGAAGRSGADGRTGAARTGIHHHGAGVTMMAGISR